MQLPTKALNALVDIKKSLLAATETIDRADANPTVEAAQLVVPSPKTTRREKKQPKTFSGRRSKTSVVQRSFHRRDWWTPSY